MFEECDPESPYSFQFIDPTRHRPTYGGKVSKSNTPLVHPQQLAVDAAWMQPHVSGLASQKHTCWRACRSAVMLPSLAALAMAGFFRRFEISTFQHANMPTSR